MRQLRAIALPLSPSTLDTYISCIHDAWENGDAVFPIDVRLPKKTQTLLLEALQPHVVIDQLGTSRCANARHTETNDALVLATSGTTGNAKGVVLTHDALRTAASITSEALEGTANDVWLACLPFAFIGGFSVITRAYYCGARIIAAHRVDEDSVSSAIREGATCTAVVPTLLQRASFDAFRKVLVGGAALHAQNNNNVISTYGMTETAGGIVYDGKPLSRIETRIDDDARIWIRSPTLARAYRMQQTDRPLEMNDGWLRTNDAGAYAHDGRLHVLGRLDDVIISGGEKVWPSDVEQAVRTRIDCDDVVAYGIPDAEWGQRVCVDIVQNNATEGRLQTSSLDQLRETLRPFLAPSALPRRLRIRKTIARNANGKVLRPQ